MGAVEESEIRELVFVGVAEAGGLERERLTAATSLLEANVDSLTLVALVARAELALGIEFTEEESAELVEARDLGELCAAIARKTALARAAESARNPELSELRGAGAEGSMEASGFTVKSPE